MCMYNDLDGMVTSKRGEGGGELRVLCRWM